MKYPKVTFVEPTPERLADYLCYVAKQIACKYYQDRRFLVLPHPVAKNTRAVFFPDLAYPRVFWEELAKFSAHEYVFHFNPKLTDQAKKLLPTPTAQGEALHKAWQQREADFFAALAEFIPSYDLTKIKNIRVLVAPFGTVGSLFFRRTGKFYDFELTVRSDFGPAQIAETILTCFFHLETTNASIPGWTNREAIIDFLLSQTKLGQIFDFEYLPTVSGLPEIPSNLVAESHEYLKRLGFPIAPVMPSIRFTPTEKRVTDGLINNKGKIVTYDQIGDWFWQDQALEKYSLYSIAKIMEKIRKKIKDAGVYQELIYTVRGQGYVLYD